MTTGTKIMATLITLAVAACAGPKPPPGWPSGQERPINPSHVSKAVK